MNEAGEYMNYIQPPFAPPSWVFGPVWSVLYILIAISFGYVFLKILRGEWPKKLALPFVINLIANAAFTPVQFGLNNLPLAAVVIMVVLVTIVWCMKAVWPYAKWIAYMQIPYLLWVSFATVLQFSITLLNT
ncbi:MAG TPA: TspO/MBR family protein [Candidatus Paceibacterota bacterium]